MSIADITPIVDLVTRLDAAKPARFAYTETAYTDNDIEGTESFNLAQENNIPNDDDTEYNTTLLDRGLRSQAASITRMGLNHFWGRFSYNLRKLTQQVLAFFGVQKKIWAHNAFEYDAQAKYLVGDVCYVMGTIGSVSTVEFFKRISTSPLELVGVAPVAGADWAPVEYRTEAFPLLTPSATGYRHRYSVADLTDSGTYDPTKWYPVTTDPLTAAIPATSEDAETLQVQIEAFTVGAVAGLTGNYRAELSVLSRFTGVSSTTDSIVFNNNIVKTSDGSDPGIANSPIGYSVLPKGQQAVVWLKGGSKYALWNSFGAVFTVRTTSYSNPAGDPSVIYNASRVFNVIVGTIIAAVAGYAPLASPAFTGNPIAPTQSALDNSTKIATTAYADAAVAVEKARALAAEAAISASSALLYVQTAVTEAGLTWDATDAYILDKAHIAISHLVGEDLHMPMPETQVIFSAARSSANPGFPRYNPLIARDIDKTITDAMAPLLVPKLRAVPASVLGTSSFSGTISGVTITFANTATLNAMIAAVLAEAKVRRWFSSNQSATYEASGGDFTGMTINIAGVDYSLTAASVGSHTLTVSGSPPSGTQTCILYPYRIQGSSTSIQLPRLSGFVPVAANDSDGVEVEGYRHMDFFQGHRMSPLTPTTSFLGLTGGNVITLSGPNAISSVATTGDPVTDGTDGAPRTAKNTSPRTAVRNVYTWAGVLLAAA